jgi:hypothetical protein
MTAPARSEVFCDTSVLLSYVLNQERVGVERLLLGSDRPKVVSETVDEEFHRVPDRREDVYQDFLKLIADDSAAVADATVAERDYLKPNDRAFFRELRDAVADSDGIEAQLRTIREKQKIVDRRFGQVEQLIDEVYPRSDDVTVLLSLGRVVDNQDECQVLCDAVAWSEDGGSGSFTSLDRGDIVSNAAEINDAITDSRDETATLDIALPESFDDG